MKLVATNSYKKLLHRCLSIAKQSIIETTTTGYVTETLGNVIEILK